MAGHREISEICLKEEEQNEMKNINNVSDKISFGDGGKEDLRNDSYCNIVKRYEKSELMPLRNAQLSVHYPHCALRPELQALSIWTCRLRCELQYLGLWKIPNTGVPYGNCSCNGSCQSYACDGQPYSSSNSQSNAGYSQMCYGSGQQSHQVQPLQTSSSPTLGNKKSARSRERFLNYQRSINTELIRVVAERVPNDVGESALQHHSNQVKPAFVDHRSISSSHLMPAFAKRRMGHTNTLHSQSDAGSYNSNGGHTTEHISNDDGGSENSSQFETTIKSRKEPVKTANNQNDYHVYKSSAGSRLEKSDQLIDSPSGWMGVAKKVNSDSSPLNNKLSNAGSVNKKLTYERRIGSGRLVPREVNWDMRSGNSKQIDKELSNTANNNGEKDKDASVGELNNRTTSIGRYSDPRTQERRIYDRRVSNSEDSNNSGSCNTNKRYTTTNFVDDRNNIDSNYHQQTPHFTGQRSMSFRRREYVDHKDHHRDFRDFREAKDVREGRENRDPRGDQHHHHNHHRDHKDEPEWFSEGPTSQHDTIELRGFEEIDDSQQQQEQTQSVQLSKIDSETSESSLLSHASSSNLNLSIKDNNDVSSEISNNSNNTTTNAHDMDTTNGAIYNNLQKTASPNTETINNNELKTDVQQVGLKPEELENSDKNRSNVTELFFDNFLNIEALENTLISSGNDMLMSANNDSGGTSRFSRWFLSSSNNNLNSNDEPNNNPPNKDDAKQNNKDINESDFNSFMSLLKCNNFPTPELPKGLPSNVSALSVEELEARMRKMDSSKIENSKSGCGDQNKPSSEFKRRESEIETDVTPQSAGTNTQDVEAFRKLLDQLGKPGLDMPMGIILPNTPSQPQSLSTHHGPYPSSISPIQPSNSLPQSNMSKPEYMMKLMHQQQIMHHQQNFGKMAPPLQLHHPNHRIPQLSPQQNDIMPLMSVSHHPHNMPMVLGHSQKRLDVQHLIQSVVREELSRSFLEKELKNPNTPPYNKEIISTVLKETFYNLTLAGTQNANDSIDKESNSVASAAPNNLIQSLARGEVSLHSVEHELNKINNINIVNEATACGSFKPRSRCGTPLSSALNVPTSGSVIVPLSPQVVPAQKQNSVLTGESPSSDQQKHQQMSSMCRSHPHDDSTLHMPTQRELQMHTQAIMLNAIYKKKIEIEQHEAIRRRQEAHKQHEIEAASIGQQHQQQSLNSNSGMSQQGHQQSSRHINSPTPLAFTPTSVLRKMTADKETITGSTQVTGLSSSSPQQMQPHLQQPHLKTPTHSQISYQHSNQPRMILGGGNFQYMHQQHQIAPPVNVNGSPQISPQQKSQIRNQPPGSLKWPLLHESNHCVLSNMGSKPMGRPILKGPGPIQTLAAQSTHNSMVQNQSNISQTPQSIQAVSQIQKYPSMQQPRQIVGQQFSTHVMTHQIPTSQQNNMQQQLFQQHQQQQRSVVMHRQQIQQNEFVNHASLQPPAHHPPCNDNNSVTSLNFQRDGGLSPTSNQLAQWFSPELLAQASAGKLPLLNMNQALSLEEFERSIQHSSTAVNN